MLDIPLFAFFLAALSIFIFGIDKSDYKLIVLAIILAVAAFFIKYSGLLLLPLFLIYASLFSKKNIWIYILIPLIFFLLWNLYKLHFYGSSMFLTALSIKLKSFFSLKGIFIRTPACLSFLSGASITLLFLSLAILKDKKNKRLFFSSCILGLLSLTIRDVYFEYSFLEKTFLFVFITNSIFIIFVVAKYFFSYFSRRNSYVGKDLLFVSVWFFIVLFFTLSINFIAARFILLMLPPAIIIICREAAVLQKSGLLKKFFLPLLICLILSIVLAIGDYHLAEIYRNFSFKLKDTLKKQRKTVFFLPAAWGYNYYLARVAYPLQEIDLDREDILRQISKGKTIFLAIPDRQPLPYEKFRDLTLDCLAKRGFETIPVTDFAYVGYIFLHNKKMHAGFYSHDWSMLPFTFSFKKSLLEKFTVHYIKLKNN
jgi:hypothetical protein